MNLPLSACIAIFLAISPKHSLPSENFCPQFMQLLNDTQWSHASHFKCKDCDFKQFLKVSVKVVINYIIFIKWHTEFCSTLSQFVVYLNPEPIQGNTKQDGIYYT